MYVHEWCSDILIITVMNDHRWKSIIIINHYESVWLTMWLWGKHSKSYEMVWQTTFMSCMTYLLLWPPLIDGGSEACCSVPEVYSKIACRQGSCLHWQNISHSPIWSNSLEINLLVYFKIWWGKKNRFHYYMSYR